MVVVYAVNESRNARMEKGGITDEPHHLLVGGLGKTAAEETEDPMQMTKSAMLKGGAIPRV